MVFRRETGPRSPQERLAFLRAAGLDPQGRALDDLADRVGLPPRAPNQPFEQRERLSGLAAPCFLPAHEVAPLLPRGLELAPQPLCPPDRHPVLVLSADHDSTGAWGTSQYYEGSIAIPYVQLSDPFEVHRGPYLFVPRAYVAGSEVARRVKAEVYGIDAFPLAHAETASVASATSTTPILDVRPTSVPTATAGGSPAGLSRIRALFEMPTIGQAVRTDPDATPDDESEVSPFLASNRVFAFDDPNGRIQPLSVELRWAAPRAPASLRRPLHLPALTSDRIGAFAFELSATTSAPTSCSAQHYPRTPPPRREKVAVIGGGPSALAAAFHLARQQDRYEVTVYTMGWRLGGKCAAGRNADKHDRIEEHGLHAFIGFYQNAFRTMREVYRTADIPLERGRAPYRRREGDGPLAEAFVGQLTVGVMDHAEPGNPASPWRYFPTSQRFNTRTPGDVPSQRWDYPSAFATALLAGVHWFRYLAFGALGVHPSAPPVEAADAPRPLRRWLDPLRSWFDRFRLRTLHFGFWLLNRWEDRGLERIAFQIEQGSRRFEALHWGLTTTRKVVRFLAKPLRRRPNIAFLASSYELLLTCLIGILEERQLDFDAFDDVDFRQWLLDHGLDPAYTNHSVINHVYETLFAHGFDAPVPDRLAAGVGLRWFLLISLFYTGFPAYEFRYSCPQTIISPYYEALKRLGVKFRFFHRLDGLGIEPGPEGASLRHVRLVEQAQVVGGHDAYIPYHRPDDDSWPAGHRPWPSRPNFDQLVDGEALAASGIDLEDPGAEGGTEILLRRGEDFDTCVLGVPLAALLEAAPQLFDPEIDRNGRWRRSVEWAAVTRTLSAQLWFKAPPERLFAGPRGLITGFAPPEPSLAAFSHLIPSERWPADDPPRFLGYHTGSDVAFYLRVGKTPTPPPLPAPWPKMFADWLHGHYKDLYDAAPATFDAFTDLLAVAGDSGERAEDRLAGQFFITPSKPSELYNLAIPGSTRFRLGQSESGVEHLVLCGDWTRTDLNCGCVEAATQSGMLAARVISNEPRYVWRVGF